MENSIQLEKKIQELNADTESLPSWINKEYFTEFLKQNLKDFQSLQTFSVKKSTKSGENYASNLMRIKLEVILDDNSSKTLNYILKTPLPSGESEFIDHLWSLFPKEIAVYREILPRFENLYRKQGVNITFAPKYFILPKTEGLDENALILEDLSYLGFSLQDRLVGLNMEYTEIVLKKLAEFHAVSARYVEVYGSYEPMFEQHMFSEDTRTLYENVKIDYYYDYIKEYKGHGEYIDLIPKLLDNYLDLSIAASTTNPQDFNVLNHGDFWLNNVMFQHSKDQIQETYFIDFQLCKYGSPALDLYMFLLSATQLDIKLKYFDYFISFYHEHLKKQLQILKYSGKIPSLKELHIDLLKYGYIGFATLFNGLSMCLYEPKSEAECNMDLLMHDSPEAEEYRKSLFLNDTFKEHAEQILPWLARRGLLE
ncbi:uncharacterized protein LOC111676960 [Lucilia cuprina]|uniref:uncharacterized protein LOC111676960 n=1 Tax=Lucilia cuprina TaxID=7375 RepID=UPI001F067824|nr:uncharacterized protein LOC111676960 [Lucilia cuprina]